MVRRAARSTAPAVALLGAWLVSHGLDPQLDAVWLSLLPLALLVLALIAGRYLGEERIERWAARRRPAAARRRAVGIAPSRRRPMVRLSGGGLLLARRLAGRAPPRTPVAA